MERLAAYLIRTSFSQERMDYLPEEAKVIYHCKDGKEKKTYDADPKDPRAAGPVVGQRQAHSQGLFAPRAPSVARGFPLTDPGR